MIQEPIEEPKNAIATSALRCQTRSWHCDEVESGPCAHIFFRVKYGRCYVNISIVGVPFLIKRRYLIEKRKRLKEKYYEPNDTFYSTGSIRLYTNELMTENLDFYHHLGFDEEGRRTEAIAVSS